jgi:hypothetical protein
VPSIDNWSSSKAANGIDYECDHSARKLKDGWSIFFSYESCDAIGQSVSL